MPKKPFHPASPYRRDLIKYCGLKAGVFVSVGKDIIHAEFPPEARPRQPLSGLAGIPAINGGVFFGITK